MKLKYDAEIDAGYVTVRRAEVVHRTQTVTTNDYFVNLDLDEHGNLLGVEIV